MTVRLLTARLFKLLSALSAAAFLPVFYLNGRVYHESYLGYFKLESSLFPQDIAQTLISAVLGWISLSSRAIAAVQTVPLEHYGKTFAIALTIIIFSLLNVIRKRIGEKEKLKTNNATPKATPTWISYIKEPAVGLGLLALSWYFIFSFFMAVALFLFALILPFSNAGLHSAKKDAEKGFINAPAVFLTDPQGNSLKYRLMECSPYFCALFGNGKAIAVPISAITWVDGESLQN